MPTKFHFSINAQLDKGTLLIGGQGAIRGGFTNNYVDFNMYLNPNLGIFVAPKFAVGASVGLQLAGQNNSAINNKSTYGGLYVSPFARYYFLKEENKFNLFGQINVGMGTSWSKNQPNIASHRFQFIPGLNVGAVYFLNPHVALEAALVANYNPNISFFSPLNQISGAIGFQIHLNRQLKSTTGRE
jgi:hypothetical protein